MSDAHTRVAVVTLRFRILAQKQFQDLEYIFKNLYIYSLPNITGGKAKG